MAAISDRTGDDEGDSGNLGKLLWGAGQLLAMGLVARFYRSFKRSHTPTAGNEAAATLQQLSERIDYKWHAYRQLIYTPSEIDEYARSATAMVLARQIKDLIDELHQQLLNLDPDAIAPVIPDIDHLRRFWNHLSQNPEAVEEAAHELPEQDERWNRVQEGLDELF